MKKTFQILGVLVLFVMLFSCSSDDDVIPDMISLVKDKTPWSADGESRSFELKSSTMWKVAGLSEWCILDITEGEGDATVKVNVLPNETAQIREAKFIFTAGMAKDTLVINQLAAVFLKLSKDKLTFEPEGNKEVLSVVASGEWIVTGETEWCTLDKASGNGNGDVEVTILANQGEERATTLVFTMGDRKIELLVVQNVSLFPFSEVKFNGLIWMDRNLGAKSVDYKNDWDNCIGAKYQWGRNIPFGDTLKIDVKKGPMNRSEIAINPDDEGFMGFIKVSSEPYNWMNEKDDNLWKDNSPGPKGWRVPTSEDFLGIFPPDFTSGSFMYSAGAKIRTEGDNKAHYFAGSNYESKCCFGIKKQGTADAYYLKWAYENYTDEEYADARVLQIYRWPATADASFYTDVESSEPKTLDEINALFTSLGEAPEKIAFPAVAYRKGSDVGYGMGSRGSYWTSDFDPTTTDGNLMYSMSFGGIDVSLSSEFRCVALPVRCVRNN